MIPREIHPWEKSIRLPNSSSVEHPRHFSTRIPPDIPLCVYVHVSASRKIEATMLGSLLSLLALLSATSSFPGSFPLRYFPLLFALLLSLSLANYYLPKITIGEDYPPRSATRSHLRVLGDGNGEDFFFYSHWCGEGGNSEGWATVELQVVRTSH